MLREKGIIDTPLLGNYKPGWDLATEFVNLYLGHGGEFFEPGTAKLAIDNDKGIATLEMMKAVSELHQPGLRHLRHQRAKPLWEAGNAAIKVDAWGSRVAGLVDENDAQPGVVENSVIAGAPTVGGGTIPAAAIWWDGFTSPRTSPTRTPRPPSGR